MKIIGPKRLRRSGFTLVETIAALFTVALTVGIFAVAFVPSYGATLRTKSSLQAVQLAQQELKVGVRWG